MHYRHLREMETPPPSPSSRKNRRSAAAKFNSARMAVRYTQHRGEGPCTPPNLHRAERFTRCTFPGQSEKPQAFREATKGRN